MTRTPSLAQLLAPMTVEEFCSQWWSRRYLHVPGSPERVTQAMGRPWGLAEAERLARNVAQARDPRNSLTAFTPPSARNVAGDHFGRIVGINPSEYWTVRESGMTVAMLRVQENDEAVARMAVDMAKSLGFIGAIRCSMWVSPKGAEVLLHYDELDTIQIQLRGTKRWRLGRSVAEPWPRSSLAAHNATDGAFGDGWNNDGPLEVDKSTLDVVEVGPGDMLYFPAGTWHGTQGCGDEDSIAFAFGFYPVGFRAMLDVVLEDAFASRPSWRQPSPASSVKKPLAEDPGVAEYFSQRSEELQNLLFKIDPAGSEFTRARAKLTARAVGRLRSVMGSPCTVTPDSWLETTPWAPITTAVGRDPKGNEVLYLYCGKEEYCFDETRTIPFGLALAEQHRFQAKETIGWGSCDAPLDWDEVSGYLEILLGDGVIRLAGGPAV